MILTIDRSGSSVRVVRVRRDSIARHNPLDGLDGQGRDLVAGEAGAAAEVALEVYGAGVAGLDAQGRKQGGHRVSSKPVKRRSGATIDGRPALGSERSYSFAGRIEQQLGLREIGGREQRVVEALQPGAIAHGTQLA